MIFLGYFSLLLKIDHSYAAGQMLGLQMLASIFVPVLWIIVQNSNDDGPILSLQEVSEKGQYSCKDLWLVTCPAAKSLEH